LGDNHRTRVDDPSGGRELLSTPIQQHGMEIVNDHMVCGDVAVGSHGGERAWTDVGGTGDRSGGDVFHPFHID
jgi:hypothetical protein